MIHPKKLLELFSILIAIMLSLGANPTLAQNNTQDATTPLPTLDIVGDSTPEEQRFERSHPMVKLSKEAIDRQANGLTFSDSIKRLPGVFTGGSPGEAKDARLRGIDKEFTRIHIDGVAIPDGGEKRELNLDRISNTLVGEVTILRNTPAEYEADGIAGQILVDTRDIPEEPLLEWQLTAGDLDGLGTNGRQASITYGNRFIEAWGFQGSLNHNRKPIEKVKRAYTANNALSEQELEEKTAVNSTLQLDAGHFYPKGEWHFKPMVIHQKEDKAKLKNKYKNGAVDKQEAEGEEKTKATHGVLVQNKHSFGKEFIIESSLAFYKTTEDKDKIKDALDHEGIANLGKRETEIEEKSDAITQTEIKVTQSWQAGVRHELKYGTKLRIRDREKRKEKYKIGELQSTEGKDLYHLEEEYAAVFVQNESFLTNKFSVMPGLRFEHIITRTDNTREPAGTNSVGNILPNLSINYRLSNAVQLYAAASQTINRPKFDELTPFIEEKDDKYVQGNPDLNPAMADAYDLGANIVSDKVFFGVNLFQRNITDLIETRNTGEIINNKPVEQTQNIGGGTIRGIELEQRWQVTSSLDINANQSFLDSKLTNDDGSITTFKEQPEALANLTLNWQLASLGTSISVGANYVSAFDATQNGDGRHSEAFFDAKITQPIGENLSMYLLAQNISDQGRTKLKRNGALESEHTGQYFYLGIGGKF